MACVYVAQGKSGLIKVGKTSDFARRKHALRADFRRYGDELVRCEKCNELDNAHGAEFSLIFEMAKRFPQYAGREWFTGATFEEVMVMAQFQTERDKTRIKFVPDTPEQAEARRLALVASRAADAANTAAFLAERKARTEARRALRLKRQTEMAVRMAAKVGLTTMPINPA